MKTSVEKFFGNKYVQLAALAAGAISVWRAFHQPQGAAGVGKVEHSDYNGARVISKDGRHAISFDIYGRGENGITVTSEMKGYGERYGFRWEYLSHIGEYKTLPGAIKAAKKYATMHGWIFNEKDFENL